MRGAKITSPKMIFQGQFVTELMVFINIVLLLKCRQCFDQLRHFWNLHCNIPQMKDCVGLEFAGPDGVLDPKHTIHIPPCGFQRPLGLCFQES